MRRILHLDMDCFYASVEVRDNPSLQGKPVAVGGEHRGVLCTCNYEARKFGLRSAMPTFEAKKLCPELILIPPHFSKYQKESAVIHDFFYALTPLVESLSLDEAYLDVSSSPQEALTLAQELKAKIVESTKLTASIGIAPNKFLAKVASEWNKPNGLFEITPEMIETFIPTLPIEKIPGVGKVTAEKLHTLGIATCGDLQKNSQIELTEKFGKWGDRLYSLCRGIDNSPVLPFTERKSLSVEETFHRDLPSLEDCLKSLKGLLNDLDKRIKSAGLQECFIKSFFVKMKFNNFQVTTVEESFQKNYHTLPLKYLLTTYKKLCCNAFLRQKLPVRLLGLGIRLGDEKEKNPKQLELFKGLHI